jgi:hypothetical protein
MDEGWNKFGFFSGMRVEKRDKTRRRGEAVCGKGRGPGGGGGMEEKIWTGYFMCSISFNTG